MSNFKALIQTKEYDFLRTNEHLGDHIILLTLGGSHAYGTNVEGSDVDIRGCALESKREILTGHMFEQVQNEATDTVVYSFRKLISLLMNCNPNTIEMLGCRPDDYLILTDIGKELLDHADLFLSQKAFQSFAGYATSQLRRLSNKAARTVPQAEQEQHILNSINNAQVAYAEQYFPHGEGDIRLYIDDAVNDAMESEIFMDVTLRHYPLRDYKCMWADMHNIVKDYARIGKRNQHAAEHGKLGKHMMHLIRLYLMCLDILEQKKIVTYREKERDFLLEIRNGKYLDERDQPVPEFFGLVDDFERRMDYAKKNTDLPEKPDYKRIEDFVADVSERIVRC